MKNQQRDIQRRTRQRRNRAIAFTILVIGVLGLAGFLFISPFVRSEPPTTVGNVIDIAADMGGFDQEEVRVKAGESVTIQLTSLDTPYHNDGGGKHQWAVDELNVSVIAPPKGSNSVTFTPDKPGTYTFYCDICCGGRANPTMQGKLIVVG